MHVRVDILHEKDGPMLKHGLQEMAGYQLVLPRSLDLRPNRDFLAERYVRDDSGHAFRRFLRHVGQRFAEAVRIAAELDGQSELFRVFQYRRHAGGGDVDVDVIGALLLGGEQLAGRVLEHARKDLLVDQVDPLFLAELAAGLHRRLTVSVIAIIEGHFRIA